MRGWRGGGGGGIKSEVNVLWVNLGVCLQCEAMQSYLEARVY